MTDALSVRSPTNHADATVTLTVPIGRNCCDACASLVEHRLRQNPHVVRVRVQPANGVATVEAHRGMTSVDELGQLAGGCCGARNAVPIPDAVISSPQHAHAAYVDALSKSPEAIAVVHSDHAGVAHAGHDMSDPRMAGAM